MVLVTRTAPHTTAKTAGQRLRRRHDGRKGSVRCMRGRHPVRGIALRLQAIPTKNRAGVRTRAEPPAPMRGREMRRAGDTHDGSAAGRASRAPGQAEAARDGYGAEAESHKPVKRGTGGQLTTAPVIPERAQETQARGQIIPMRRLISLSASPVTIGEADSRDRHHGLKGD